MATLMQKDALLNKLLKHIKAKIMIDGNVEKQLKQFVCCYVITWIK